MGHGGRGEFLPYVLLVTIPFFGSFSGTELILRLSIIILAFITAGEFIPNVKYVLDIIPNCKACLLTALVICVPLSVIPYPAVWLYGWLLWLMEPVLLCIETVLALNLVMQFSRNCAEKIEEDEDEAWKWKVSCQRVVVDRNIQSYTYNDDLELSDVDEDSSPWRSPFLVKVAVVILVTQYTTQLYDHSCSHTTPAWPWSLLPNDIIVGRVFQVLLGNCFYIWTLYRADDWQLSDCN
ncbi:hypothetical protein MAR_008445 [Mya arenaria]|uniref:Uncharacterized protein n=1 Tax=Mya arenaria TaxID=6604 RepID=A0ABY7DZ59_MYAAR|nr:hypothetical protein MAR_008445 [Mya arenaria]